MAETDRAYSTADVVEEPAGQGRPEDPALSSPESIKAKLVEETSTAAGMSFGAEEKTGIETASAAIAGLTQALTSSDAVAAEAESQLGLAEVEAALQRGIPADEVLAAGISSGVLSAEAAERISWDAARRDQGYETDAELEEFADDSEWESIEEQAQLLQGTAAGLASYQTEAKRSQQASESVLKQSVANHASSSAALRALQHEIGLSGDEMRQHLSQIDAEAEAGILGVQVDLDRLAQNDPELFTRALNAISATVRASENDFEGRVVKTNVFANQPDFAAGWVIDGQPSGPEQYVPGIDPEKLAADAVRLAQGRGRYDGPVALPANRDVKDGWTQDGRPTAMDDVKLLDGTTAKSRLAKEMREGRSS